MLTQERRVIVGSSGAIIGLLGFQLAVIIRKFQEYTNQELLLVSKYIGLLLLLSIFPFTGFLLHIGGLVSGFLIGLVSMVDNVGRPVLLVVLLLLVWFVGGFVSLMST